MFTSCCNFATPRVKQYYSNLKPFNYQSQNMSRKIRLRLLLLFLDEILQRNYSLRKPFRLWWWPFPSGALSALPFYDFVLLEYPWTPGLLSPLMINKEEFNASFVGDVVAQCVGLYDMKVERPNHGRCTHIVFNCVINSHFCLNSLINSLAQ